MPRSRVALPFLFIFPCILAAQSTPEHPPQQPTGAVAGATARDAAIDRLTSHSGLDTDAAWSPDGRSIAYASDRSGNFDIWVQPVDGGGEPTQITTDAAGDWQPHWAPDGKRLVFRSERDGGGLFVVSAQGGDLRRLTAFGYQPQWSPDGRRILFTASHLLVMSQRQRFYTVNEAGGEPLEVLSAAGERFASVPVAGWHPDGRRVSLAGLDEQRRVLVRTTAIGAEKTPETQLDSARLGETDTYRVSAVAWSLAGDALFLVATDTVGVHVWRVPVDAETGKRKGPSQQIATRAYTDEPISLSPDRTRLAFTMARQASRIWTYPLESTRGRIAGPPRAITPADAWAVAPDFSPDGKKLVYVLHPDPWGGGGLRLELHEWTASGLRTLVADDAARFAPRVSRDGRYVAFRVASGGPNAVVAVLDSVTLKERRLTSSSLFATAFGWTHDNASILSSIRQVDPPRHGLFRVPFTEGEAPSRLPSVAVHPKYDIWQGTQSPDGKWIAFIVQEPNPRWSAIFLVPTAGGPWIQVTDGRGWDDKPRWSADGRLLYFVTSRGGPYTVAAVGIDQVTGKPAGPAAEVLSWPAPRLGLLGDVGWNELGLGADALAVPLLETTGSIWTSGATGAAPRPDASTSCADLVLPDVLERPAPVYTPEARRRKLAGTVHLDAVVGSDGRVRSLRVNRSPDARLNPEAVRAASRWMFRPARCKGENIAAAVAIDVVFAPK